MLTLLRIVLISFAEASVEIHSRILPIELSTDSFLVCNLRIYAFLFCSATDDTSVDVVKAWSSLYGLWVPKITRLLVVYTVVSCAIVSAERWFGIRQGAILSSRMGMS